MSEQMSKRDKQKLYLIDVVMRQTDYDSKTAEDKLKEFDFNAVCVIRDFMGIDNKKKETALKSINQQIYGEIRNMMDDAASKYRIKKELEKKQEELLEQRRIIYERMRKFHLAAYKIQCFYKKYCIKRVVEITI